MARTPLLVGVIVLGIAAAAACGATFHPIVSIVSSTGASDLRPASDLIQGPGVGFDASEPHDKLGTGLTGLWVTDAPGGFPADYIAVAGAPVLELDLGTDRLLTEISTWGYPSANANGVSEFSLRFATDADGPAAFATSVTYGPTFFPTSDDVSRQSFVFSQAVTARYVEFTAEDNFFIPPGDGSGGETVGGDRVGLSEIAFDSIPEPATLLLVGMVVPVLLNRKRR